MVIIMKNKFIIVILLIISTAAVTFFTISSNYKAINVMNNKSSRKKLNKEEMPNKWTTVYSKTIIKRHIKNSRK